MPEYNEYHAPLYHGRPHRMAMNGDRTGGADGAPYLTYDAVSETVCLNRNRKDTNPLCLAAASSLFTMADFLSNHVKEVLVGATDGVNQTFTTTYPISGQIEDVEINGISQAEGVHYIQATATSIVIADPPHPGDFLEIKYLKG